MKTTLRLAAIVALPLTLAACNETSNSGYGGGYGRGGGGGLFGSGGLFGGSSDYDDRDYGRSGRRGGGPYAYNGRCDDPRYETSNGGRAEAGTDDFDCSRYGGGLKR